MKWRFLFLMAFGLFINSFQVPTSYAASFEGTSSAIFINPQPSAASVTGVGTNSISWGTPIPGSSQGSLFFESSQFSINSGENVPLGRISFSNGSLSAGAISSVEIRITINFTTPSGAFKTFTKTIAIINTPNTGTPEENADRISLPLGFPSLAFTDGGQQFQFSLLGFGSVSGGGFSSAGSLSVFEEDTATADLIGRIDPVLGGSLLSKTVDIAILATSQLAKTAAFLVGHNIFCVNPSTLKICAEVWTGWGLQAIEYVFEVSRIADDPPDLNFSKVFIPRNFMTSHFESSPDSPEEITVLANQLLRENANLYSLTQAWRVSLERYNAAISFGDMKSAEKQNAAMEAYIQAYTFKARVVNQLILALIDESDSLFGPVQISKSDFENSQAELAQNGFSSQIQQIINQLLNDLELPQDRSDELANALLTVNSSDLSFPLELFNIGREIAETYREMAVLTSCVGNDCLSSTPFEKFQINKAVVDVKSKNGKRIFKKPKNGRDRFNIQGRLSLTNNEELKELPSKYVTINFGTFSSTIPGSEFVRNFFKNGFKFKRDSRNIKELKIFNSGKFEINVRNLELSNNDFSNPIKFSLRIGNHIGEFNIQFDKKGKFRADCEQLSRGRGPLTCPR